MISVWDGSIKQKASQEVLN